MADKKTSKIPKLEVVLKCDSAGSLEAVTRAFSELQIEGIDINIIHGEIGNISKSDILPAETASRLIIGFQVDVLPGINKIFKEHHVEIRLYDVIYDLIADIKDIAESMIPISAQEQITGTAKIIALFKGNRKGTIIGCEVLDGSLAVGRHFRIISAMGPVYSDTIRSLHIKDSVVQKASKGQQVGLKIEDFKEAKIGDIIECFRSVNQKTRTWQPSGEIIRK